MTEILSIDAFLARGLGLPVVDARTPAEFAQGHIPGAVNIPLFSDAERALVGTTYKHSGRQPAILLGLEMVGPRLPALAAALLDTARPVGGRLLLHCWRGGMRSASLAWLGTTLGCEVATLEGGYKAFRRHVLTVSPADQRRVLIVSGLTGSGKTEVLHALAGRGQQTVDLEHLARHKGSVFGDLGEATQPSQEQFENDLVTGWRATDPARPVWIEDESRTIGRCHLPSMLWDQMPQARRHMLVVPGAERIARLQATYANYPLAVLEARVDAIRRRLGGDRADLALADLRAGQSASACAIILSYYDRSYERCLAAAPATLVQRHEFSKLDPLEIAAILEAAVKHEPSIP